MCPAKIQLLTFLERKAKSSGKSELPEHATVSTEEGRDSRPSREDAIGLTGLGRGKRSRTQKPTGPELPFVPVTEGFDPSRLHTVLLTLYGVAVKVVPII